MTRLGNDVENLSEMFSAGLIALIADLVMMAAFAGVLFWLNWKLAAVAMIVVPLMAGAAIVFRWKVRDAFRVVRVKIARINSHLQETITGMRVVQLFAREQRNLDEFMAINREHRDAWFYSIQYESLLSATITLAGNLTTAFILWYGAKLLGVGSVAPGDLLLFVDWMRRFYRPLQDLSAKYSVMQSSMASLERVFQLLDIEAERAEPESASGPRKIRGEIVFENVNFAYEAQPILKNLSFRVAPGERVALVGHTGAGKTTVLKLLARMYEPQSGRILIDGTDIRDIPRAELRRHMAFVLQDVFLFTGDLAYNVSLGRRRRSRRPTIESAARTVHLEEFVRTAPARLRPAGPRARAELLGGRAPAALVRAGAGSEARDPAARRGHLERRHGDRGADPGRAAHAHVRQDLDRGRAPALDDPGRRPHLRAPPRRAARVRPPRGSARAARTLLAPLPAPVRRPGTERRLSAGRADACHRRAAPVPSPKLAFLRCHRRSCLPPDPP